MQGLWIAPWLIDVEGVDRAGVVRHLFVMALAPSIGALLLGLAADRLNRRGIGPQAQLTFITTVFVAAQFTLILGLPVPSYLPWSIVAAAVSATVLSYAILAEYVPEELTGRINGVLNLFHFGAAFAVQYAIGLAVQHWASENGHYPAIAYRVAFGLNLVLQVAALAWFELPRIRKLLSIPASTCIGNRVRHQTASTPAGPYQRALRVWLGLCEAARAEATSWRRAALGSAALSALLAGTLVWTAARQSVISHVIDLDRVHTANILHSLMQPVAPSDAQIAYFLGRFVSNVRSLSLDPIVVRANWLEAFDYATEDAVLTLNNYARDADPFAKIGAQAVIVEVMYVVRASTDSFEIRWRERSYQGGILTRIDSFTGMASIVFNFAAGTNPGKNPLGLYIRALDWAADLSAHRT